jgi:hypothetical protein
MISSNSAPTLNRPAPFAAPADRRDGNPLTIQMTRRRFLSIPDTQPLPAN